MTFFKSHSTATKWAGLVAIVLLTCIVSSAQTTGFGTISGSVIDASQAIIVGAKVTITNVATGVVRRTVTNDTGYYEVDALIPGSYRISVVQTGFREIIREGITLEANGHVSVPAQLSPGMVTESVTVREEAILLNTESGRQGEVLTTKQVESLPTSGVNPIWLISLAPGVTPGWGQSASTSGTLGWNGVNNGVAVYGIGSRIEFSLDGAPNMQNRSNALNPAEEEIGEMTMDTTGFDASVGHSIGAGVTMTTKAGTNSLHGSLRNDFQNQRWAAMGHFQGDNYKYQLQKAGCTSDTSSSTCLGIKSKYGWPGTHENNIGAAIGGPIYIPIEYSLLREAMILSIGTTISSEDELEHFMNEIQTCSFLVRSGKNDGFRFAHKSFLEFLVAKRLVSDILRGTLPDNPVVADPKKALLNDSAWAGSGSSLEYFHLANYYSISAPLLFWGKSELLSARSVLRGVLLADKTARELVESGTKVSQQTFKAQIESSILSLFGKTNSKVIEDVGLSEEIATFALEDLENRGISIQEVIVHLKSDQLKELFAEILRLSRSVSFTERNGPFLKEQAKTIGDKILRSVFCGALARVPGAVDDAFVQNIRLRMAPDEWTYFLFEIGRNGNANRTVLASILGDRDLRPVDRVLCAWGLGVLDKAGSGEAEKSTGNREAAGTVESLLRSDDAKEVELGIALCGFVEIGESKLAEIMFEFIDRSADSAVKRRAIDQLGLLSTEQAWKRMRSAAAQERHADVRRDFERVEKLIRDNISLRRNRRSWQAVKDDRRLRESMWRLLR